MIWTLYRIELFKMVKRPAARITVLIFAALLIFSTAMSYINSLSYENAYFGFPYAWDVIFGLIGMPVSIFSSVLIILLVANEFDWRTSRQNIIDGLSKRHWFLAKLMLLPTTVLLFYISLLIYDVTLAWLATDPTIENAYDITRTQYLALLGILIGVLCITSIALLFSLLTRTAGAALGITIVYPMIEGRIAQTIRGFDYEKIADCFPTQVVNALLNYAQYFPVGSQRRGWTVMEWDTPWLFAAGIGWMVVFVLLSWLIYYKRDL